MFNVPRSQYTVRYAGLPLLFSAVTCARKIGTPRCTANVVVSDSLSNTTVSRRRRRITNTVPAPKVLGLAVFMRFFER